MKQKDIILLSLSAAFVIIGTHLTITFGLSTSYPVFMLAVVLLFWYQYRKLQQRQQEQEAPQDRLTIKDKLKKK